eukprot:SAG11_NODE_34997_length_269_cov_0.523529_1_plen_60_part_10
MSRDHFLKIRAIQEGGECHLKGELNTVREYAENFKIGELVRLSLDGAELNKFKYRPSKKL